MPQFPSIMTLEDMKYFDLFDDIPYKEVKYTTEFYDNSYDMDIEIYERPHESQVRKIIFTFSLIIDDSPEQRKKYDIEKEFDANSHYSLKLNELADESDSEDDDEYDNDYDESDEDEDEDEDDILSRQQ
jgi:hypothetical protein